MGTAVVRQEADASLHGARDVIEGDKGGCKARANGLRRDIPQARPSLDHTGEAPEEAAWRIHDKMAKVPDVHRTRRQERLPSCTARWRNGRGQTMVPSAGNNLRQLMGWRTTAWADTRHCCQPIVIKDKFLQGACETPVALALVLHARSYRSSTQKWPELRVARLQGVNSGHMWMTSRSPQLRRQHGLHVSSGKCPAHCTTPGAVDKIQNDMPQHVIFTPSGWMILSTASGGEYRTEATASDRKTHDPAVEI